MQLHIKKGKKKGMRPPLRYYLEKVFRDMGGISHWAVKAVSLKGKRGSERQAV